jgi:hypothetical protein
MKLLMKWMRRSLYKVNAKIFMTWSTSSVLILKEKMMVSGPAEIAFLPFLPSIHLHLTSRRFDHPSDAKVARNLHKNEMELEKRRKEQKSLEENKNESTALRVAIEERKRVAMQAQAKRSLAEADEKYARKSVLDDLEADWKYQEQCKDDEKCALEVCSSTPPPPLPQPLLYVPCSTRTHKSQLKQQLDDEEKAERDTLQHEQDDEELARQLQLEMEHELELQESHLLDSDSRYAQEIQSNIDRTTDEEIGRGQSSHQQVEEKDQLLAMKLLTQSAREAYEQNLSRQLHSTHDTIHLNSIAKQWEDCHVEITNVMNGLCLSFLLPHLKSLKINFCDTSKNKNKKNKNMKREERSVMVLVEASRMILTGDKNAMKKNSSYSAEFEIQGGEGVELTERDMSYKYSSESGLLHIYLEKVEMVEEEEEMRGEEKDEKRGEEKGDDDEDEKGLRGRAGGYWFNKESFLRIFNKQTA